MNARHWRRGRRTEVDAIERHAIKTGRRPQKQLAQEECAPGNVAANVVGIVLLEFGRPLDGPGRNTVTKPGRKPLYLALNCLNHASPETLGHVAIGPARVFPCGGAFAIKEARLGQEHIRSLNRFSSPGRALRLRDLCKRSSQVDCTCLGALRSAPLDLLMKRRVAVVLAPY